MTDYITLSGVKTFNLKGFDLSLPKGNLSLITGPRGSGKAALIEHTLYNEILKKTYSCLTGQRRKMFTPLVQAEFDSISGIQAAINFNEIFQNLDLEQSLASFLRLERPLKEFFRKHGALKCADLVCELAPSSKEVVQEKVFSHSEKDCLILVPLKFSQLKQSKLKRVVLSGKLVAVELVEEGSDDLYYEALVDAFSLREDKKDRFSEAIKIASEYSAHLKIILVNSLKDLRSGSAITPKDPFFYLSSNSHFCPKCELDDLGNKEREYYLEKVSYHEFITKEIGELRVVAEDYNLNLLSGLADSCTKLGLGSLRLDSKLASLSSGERLKLIISSFQKELYSNTIFILSQPSHYLHRIDLELIVKYLKGLCSSNNTCLLVDEQKIGVSQIDYLVELDRGELSYSGLPRAIGKPESKEKKKNRKFEELVYFETESFGAQKIALNAITVVTGRNGAGKTRLLRCIEEAATRGELGSIKGAKYLTGEDSLGRNKRSFSKKKPQFFSSRVGVGKLFAELYSSLPRAKSLGFSDEGFLLDKAGGGSCKKCYGRGQVIVDLDLLGQAYEVCNECHGARFLAQILDVEYNGLTISDVLSLSVNQAISHFSSRSRIVEALQKIAKFSLGACQLNSEIEQLLASEQVLLELALLRPSRFSNHVLLLDQPFVGLEGHRLELVFSSLRRLLSHDLSIVICSFEDDFADFEICL